jgi:hypothetical protein
MTPVMHMKVIAPYKSLCRTPVPEGYVGYMKRAAWPASLWELPLSNVPKVRQENVTGKSWV